MGIKMSTSSTISNLLKNIPWLEVLANILKNGRKLILGLSHEGMYEVLEYEAVLELLDRNGKKARYKKRKKIRYLQDNIIAYQDYAWGDGEILRAYRCTPGKSVDRYRFDYKTHILISLREVKNRGDIDEFNIQWKMKNVFLKPDESWTTDISNRTKNLRISVIFPKERHPTRLALVENNQRKTQSLSSEQKKRLPNGRLRVTWEVKKPRLYEHYIIKWSW
jgi:hypothetical protein